MIAENLGSALRLVHITCGSLVIVVSLAMLLLPKGGPLHRRGGAVFVVLGRTVIASALFSVSWVLIDTDSFVGDSVTGRELVEVRSTLPRLFAVLGVLGLMVAFDVERGLIALRSGVAGVGRGRLLGWPS